MLRMRPPHGAKVYCKLGIVIGAKSLTVLAAAGRAHHMILATWKTPFAFSRITQQRHLNAKNATLTKKNGVRTKA